MKKVFWLSLIIISLGVVLLSVAPHQPPPKLSSAIRPSPKAEKYIRYQSRTVGQSIVHTLFIPSGSQFSVIPALSPELSSLKSFAQKHQALAAINAGFFDPQNQKSTSYVVRQQTLVADPHLNKRLMDNPANRPYLKQILNRTEFRRYRCGSSVHYDIALHSEPSPIGCQLLDAMGGGPRLLPELTLVQEGFVDYDNGKIIRDPLGSHQPNARTAVGVTHEGSILLVMVAQNPLSSTTSGMSLIELVAFMKTQGIEKAMNLDGGSSSSFYYKGKTVYGKVDTNGDQIRRQVKSVLLVRQDF